MNEQCFSVELQTSGRRMGYMVMYRGQPVRGGGTSSGAVRYRGWQKDYQRYGESTAREIASGLGSKRDYERIAEIDAELEGTTP